MPADDAGTPDDGGGDSGGCATSGTESPQSGLAMIALAAFGIAVIVRSRKKR